jgi:hypothetical protein
MPVSGKTAAPWEIPYLKESDIPDMGAGDKAIAERVHALLDGTDVQDLDWLKSGSKKQIVVCNSSGVPQYVTASGDVTNDESGVFTIGTGKVTNAKLASPNNSTYKMLLSSQESFNLDAAAGTYILGTGASTASGGSITNLPVPVLSFAKADYEVAGLTQKLRLRVQILANGTKPTIKFTFGLYPISAVGGGGDELKMTLGTVVSESTVAVNEPSSSGATRAVGSDFTIPGDQSYALGVVTSGTLTNSSACLLSAHLQTRNV